MKKNTKKDYLKLLVKILRFSSIILPFADKKPNPKNIRQIAVVGDMGIGNFIMMMPMLMTLRKNYPDAEIVLIYTKGRVFETLIKRIDVIDRTARLYNYFGDKKMTFGTFRKSLDDENINPDMLISRFNRNPNVPLLLLLRRVKWRVGHVTSAGFVGVCDRVYNFPVKMELEEHEVVRNLNLMRAVGLQEIISDIDFKIFDKEIESADHILEEHGIDDEKLVCIQAGSSDIQMWKRWPEEHWIELINMLIQDGYQVVMMGSKEEFNLSESIISGCGSSNVFNFCGKMQLGESAAFLKRAKVLICNDSGLMHVGAAVGVYVIGLFGPTDYERTCPWGDHFSGIRVQCECNTSTLLDADVASKIDKCASPCMKRIKPSSVYQEFKQQIVKL